MTEPIPESIPQPLTDPRFEGFTVQLSLGSDPETAGPRARAALEASLGRSAEGWRIEPVHPSEPGLFDLLPPQDGELGVREAWDVTYALLEQPSVIDAEPSFEIVPDAGDVKESTGEEDEAEALALAPAAGSPPIFSKHDPEWCPKLIAAPEAWEVAPHPGGDGLPPGKSRGEDIVVGHPDSGYRTHQEIRDTPNRFLDERGFDFIDDDLIEEDEHGGHGLGTASVIMSTKGGTGQKFVTGVAPKAGLIPYRVAKPHLFFPSPVLFSSGMMRLGKSIFQAVDAGCHVISISLGWLPHDKVRRAVKYAFDKDVIVVAAAGNRIRVLIVWPAAYPEVICCAGCTSKRRVWSSSSRGKRIDVTGPAEDVWKAAVDGSNNQRVEQSSGTSFAAASIAGIAALWLARWGRERLLRHLNGELRLTTLFRKMLMDTCDPEPENADGDFGKGIVNAKKLLEAPLPSLEELRSSDAPILEAVSLAVEEPTSVSGMRTVAEAFSEVPRSRLRSEVSGLLGVPEHQLEARLHGVGRELVFQILTDSALRETVLAGEVPPDASPAEAAHAMAMPRQRLQAMQLSERLRSRISSL